MYTSFHSNPLLTKLNSGLYSGSFVVDEPSLYEQFVHPWELRVSPLSDRPFSYAMTYVSTPGVTLQHAYCHEPVRMQGLSPINAFGLSIPVSWGTKTSYWSKPLENNQVPILMPCGMDNVISARQTHFIILIDLDLMRHRYAAEMDWLEPTALTKHFIGMPNESVKGAEDALECILDTVQNTPNWSNMPVVATSVKEDLMFVVDSLIFSVGGKHRPRRTTRIKGLSRALGYLQSENSNLVTVSELCSAALVSVRTLEYAFMDNFGLSIRGYLQLRRLHAARRMLREADSSIMSVTDIATSNGFYQLGEFARRYRKLFGELPSDTLRTPRITKGSVFLRQPLADRRT